MRNTRPARIVNRIVNRINNVNQGNSMTKQLYEAPIMISGNKPPKTVESQINLLDDLGGGRVTNQHTALNQLDVLDELVGGEVLQKQQDETLHLNERSITEFDVEREDDTQKLEDILEKDEEISWKERVPDDISIDLNDYSKLDPRPLVRQYSFNATSNKIFEHDTDKLDARSEDANNAMYNDERSRLENSEEYQYRLEQLSRNLDVNSASSRHEQDYLADDEGAITSSFNTFLDELNKFLEDDRNKQLFKRFLANQTIDLSTIESNSAIKIPAGLQANLANVSNAIPLKYWERILLWMYEKFNWQESSLFEIINSNTQAKNMHTKWQEYTQAPTEQVLNLSPNLITENYSIPIIL